MIDLRELYCRGDLLPGDTFRTRNGTVLTFRGRLQFFLLHQYEFTCTQYGDGFVFFTEQGRFWDNLVSHRLDIVSRVKRVAR